MLLTPAERLWLYLAGVLFAAAAGFAGAFWLCIGLGGYRPGLFGFWWGCIWAMIWIWFSILHERRRSLDDLDRTALRIQEGEVIHRKLYGDDVIEMPRTFQQTSPTDWQVLDLDRAAGRPGAAEKFVDELKRRLAMGNKLELNVEFWKSFTGVGRPPFERMRAELERCEYVRKGNKGAYEFTDAGRQWLTRLPH